MVKTSMGTGKVLLVAACMMVVPLVGCVGGSDGIDPQADDVSGEMAATGNPAQAYLANAEEGPATEIETRDALSDGVPSPTGISRYIDVDQENVFEPTIGVTSNGTLFISNLGGEIATSYSSVLRSTDQGETWEDATSGIGPVSTPPQSNDPYVYVDEATDRVFNMDMQGLQCNWLRWSDDEGDTWMNNPAACGQPPTLQDHPTLFAGPPGPDTLATDETIVEQGPYENVVYVCANRVVAEASCARSLDGGHSWGPWRELVTGTQATEDGCLSGLTGHGTTGPDGTVYLPAAVNYEGGCGAAGDPLVTISRDSGLTWEPVIVSESVASLNHEVAVATDDEGNVFAFWISEDLRPHLATSQDAGQTWSAPVDVAPPNVTLTEFPTIAATGSGSLAMAYIGTDADVEAHDEVPDEAGWNAYLTTITDATEDELTVFTTTANDPEDPIARGPCNSANRCYGEEGGALGDFIDIVIDEEGRPWAAFVDACTQACVEDPSAGMDVATGFVGTLNEGPSLQDPTLALDPLISEQ